MCKRAFGAEFAFRHLPTSTNFCFKFLLEVILWCYLLSWFDSFNFRIEWRSGVVFVSVVVVVIQVLSVIIAWRTSRRPLAFSSGREHRSWCQRRVEGWQLQLHVPPGCWLMLHVEAALLFFIWIAIIDVQFLVIHRTHISICIPSHARIVYWLCGVLWVLVKL